MAKGTELDLGEVERALDFVEEQLSEEAVRPLRFLFTWVLSIWETQTAKMADRLPGGHDKKPRRPTEVTNPIPTRPARRPADSDPERVTHHGRRTTVPCPCWPTTF